MYYNRDEFFRLMEAIEEQGGDHLDEIHEHVYIPDLINNSGRKGIEALNCGASALFEIPYESVGEHGMLTTAKACAVDDRLGLWPRFAAANAPGTGD